MRSIPTLFTVFFILSFVNKTYSQPGGGGLQIFFIHDRNGVLIDKKDTALKVRRFILSGKKQQYITEREFIPTAMDLDPYGIANMDKTHIFLPPYARKKNGKTRIPNQGLELIYKEDTMRIDFIGVIGENGSGYSDRVERIGMMTGYFQYHRKLLPSPDTSLGFRVYIQAQLHHGLDYNNLHILKTLGYIHHIPDPYEREKIEKLARLSCRDTTCSYLGYWTLCYHMIQSAAGRTNIISKAQAVTDSTTTYSFIYYYTNGSDMLYSRKITNENRLADSALNRLITGPLSINGQPFTGYIRLAAPFVGHGVEQHFYHGWTLYTLQFIDGKQVGKTVIPDANLFFNDERMR
jgi:hypothetical protein